MYAMEVFVGTGSCSCSLAVLDPRVGHTMDVQVSCSQGLLGRSARVEYLQVSGGKCPAMSLDRVNVDSSA